MKYDYLELANILKKRRENLKISTRKLGEKIGISNAEISRIENGLKPNFSFVILIKLCNELQLDLVEVLCCVGLLRPKEDKLFYVMFKQDDEIIFKIHAKNNIEAMLSAYDFVFENQLIDFTKSNKDLLIGVEDDINKFDNEIVKEYENSEEKLSEDDDSEEEIVSVICPEDCLYYCPICGECLREE